MKVPHPPTEERRTWRGVAGVKLSVSNWIYWHSSSCIGVCLAEVTPQSRSPFLCCVEPVSRSAVRRWLPSRRPTRTVASRSAFAGLRSSRTCPTWRSRSAVTCTTRSWRIATSPRFETTTWHWPTRYATTSPADGFARNNTTMRKIQRSGLGLELWYDVNSYWA